MTTFNHYPYILRFKHTAQLPDTAIVSNDPESIWWAFARLNLIATERVWIIDESGEEKKEIDLYLKGWTDEQQREAWKAWAQGKGV